MKGEFRLRSSDLLLKLVSKQSPQGTLKPKEALQGPGLCREPEPANLGSLSLSLSLKVFVGFRD